MHAMARPTARRSDWRGRGKRNSPAALAKPDARDARPRRARKSVAPATSPDDRLRKTCGREETTERTKRCVGRRTPDLGGDVAVGQKVNKARSPPVPAAGGTGAALLAAPPVPAAGGTEAALPATTMLGTHATTAVATAKAATNGRRIFLTPWPILQASLLAELTLALVIHVRLPLSNPLLYTPFGSG